MKHFSQTATDTENISLILAKKLRGGDVVFLRGDLGSGKTTFTKGLAKYFGIRQTILSPTFVLARPYPIPRPGRSRAQRLVHIDAYRLTSARDLASIGWDELIQPDTLIVVENPGRLFTRYLPRYVVELRLMADGRRAIEF